MKNHEEYGQRLKNLRRPAVDLDQTSSFASLLMAFLMFFLGGGLVFGGLFYFIISLPISSAQATVVSAIISGFFGMMVEVLKHHRE